MCLAYLQCTSCKKCSKKCEKLFNLVIFSIVLSIVYACFYTASKVIRFIGFITCRAASIIPLFVCTFWNMPGVLHVIDVTYRGALDIGTLNVYVNKRRLLINNNQIRYRFYIINTSKDILLYIIKLL